jgi:hypothetical protein
MMRWLQEGYLKTLLEKLGCWLFRSLTRDQKALQERIASAVKTSCDREIVFTSEWLGYLPFGCYCWLEYTNEEGVIQDIDMPFGCGERDLAALERHGFLQKTGERRNPDDSFDYSLNYRVRPERTRHDPENSERSSRRRRSEFT